MNEKQILARIDTVSEAIDKANPDTLGKQIRLLDAMRRIAVGKRWVDAIGSADAWALRGRRRAGEIIEDTPVAPGVRAGPGKGRGKMLTQRKSIRDELGISEHESQDWQALAKIPEPVFEEYVEKVRAREEPGTLAGAMRYAGSPEKRKLTVHIVKTDEAIVESIAGVVEDFRSEIERRLLDIADAEVRAKAAHALIRGLQGILEKLREYAKPIKGVLP